MELIYVLRYIIWVYMWKVMFKIMLAYAKGRDSVREGFVGTVKARVGVSGIYFLNQYLKIVWYGYCASLSPEANQWINYMYIE